MCGLFIYFLYFFLSPEFIIQNKNLFSEHLNESFSLMTIKYYTIQKFVDIIVVGQLKTLRKYTNGIDNFGNFGKQ